VLDDDPNRAQAQHEQLEVLKQALEAYSDLLVAEGVHQVVTGHADRAADAMDAAAGFGRPPSLDFARTPPSGYRLETSVVAVFPYREPGAAALPIELVDASLADFIASRVGEVERWVWTLSEGGGSTTVSLSDLGLSALETILVTEDFLAEAARSKAALPSAKVEGPAAHRIARQLAGALGPPALLSDVSQQPNVPDAEQQAVEASVRIELTARLEAVRVTLQSLVDAVVDGMTDAECLDWLRSVVPWGIVGAATGNSGSPLAELLFGGRAPKPGELGTLVAGARDSLKARLANVPDEPHKLSAARLALAIADIAARGGRLTVTARWSREAILLRSGLAIAAEPAGLESDWLATTASVRPQLARLEALQLEAQLLGNAVPLHSRCNKPDDLWRTDVVARNAQRRLEPDPDRPGASQLAKLDLQRLIVSFGSEDAWQADDVAVALIDQFSEAVPMAQRSTYAAFGFNAPAARPPQAILLAVPPRSDRALDQDVLFDILEQTRELLRARAALPEDVGRHPATPTMWFDGASPLRLRLDSGTQYWR
jgi:hypothetical protein